MTYSLKAQAAEVKRQLAMMRGVYPKMIEAGHLDRADADCDLQLMADAAATLDWLERNQARVKAALGGTSRFAGNAK
jgi:hypothetical protein